MRLDKFLKDTGFGSRKSCKDLIKNKQIKVNGKIITDSSININEFTDLVEVDNLRVIYEKYHYYMLNKPAGLVTSTSDKEKTVMSLIKEFNKYELVPVGRLDKDTLGLLLITDNGPLVHALTSPKHHVEKVYNVLLAKDLSKEDALRLEEGITLEDGYKCLRSKVEFLASNLINLTIYEGKYHQVKRMMEAVDNKVVSLKRIKFGPLALNDELLVGMYRNLNKDEIEALEKLIK